jgi:C1A family cysteine protease
MNKILLIALLALVCTHDESEIFTEFRNYIQKYNKNYASMNEFLARYAVFKHNFLRLRRNDVASWEGITKFSDMTEQEFARKYLTFNYDAMAALGLEKQIFVSNGNDVPEAFDWREKGYVTRVRDQGSCGSCWAFSAMANIEGQYFKLKGELKEFSEQFLVDCDTIDYACQGGLMMNTFEFISQNGGFMYLEDYEYKGVKRKCEADPAKYVDAKVVKGIQYGTGSDTWREVDEEELKKILVEVGPLAVALNASSLSSYVKGVFDPTSCSVLGMNHAVTMVGYGHDEEEDKDYWLIKNSWGEDFGEDGYFRIRRGTGKCGINRYISTAVLE